MTNLAIVVVKVASSRNYLDCSCIEPQENVGNCGQSWAAKLLKLQKTPVFMRGRSDYESAALPLSYLGPSVNPLPLAQQPQADGRLPTVLGQFGATHRDKKDNLTTLDNN